jgi:myo-inositol-1(or 4)-monophosphatase
MTVDPEHICRQVCDIAIRTGAYIRSDVDKLKNDDIRLKGHNDFVTVVDTTSERLLTEALTRVLPEAGFIVEEGTASKKGARYNWVVDPLDGTTNFIHAIPVFAVSIALLDGDATVAGVVYDVMRGECFYAWHDGGAYLNGAPIHVSPAPHLSDALLATGFPYSDFSHMDKYLQLLGFLMGNCHGIRRMGSAAIDLAYVACGRFEGFFEYGLHPWDVAAGTLIVKEAGGSISDFRGGEDYLFGREIIAANEGVFRELQEIVSHYL